MILVQFLEKIEALGILCRISIAYYIANHLKVAFRVSVSVRRGFPGARMGCVILLWPPWAFHIIKILKVQILGTCKNCCTLSLIERVHTISTRF